MVNGARTWLYSAGQSLARYRCRRRQGLYGSSLSADEANLLQRDPTSLTLVPFLRIIAVSLRFSPLRYVRLWLDYLSDQDTRKRIARIRALKEGLERQLDHRIQVVDRYFERRLYSHDIGDVPPFLEKLLFRTTPFLVVRPESERDIVDVFRFARNRRIPVFSRGVGSSGIGESIPTANGIVIDCSPLDRIIGIDRDAKTVTVQAGAKWGDIANALASEGLMLKTAPTSRYSTVGGWLSTGGYGLHSYRWGHLREHVESFTVVHPTGETVIIRKDDEVFPYYFQTEGQMGIFSEVTLSVIEQSMCSLPVLYSFDTPERAFDFIGRLTRGDIHPTHVKFYDRHHIEQLNRLHQAQKTDGEDALLPLEDMVLLHFSTESEAEKLAEFESALPQGSFGREVPWRARLLWNERFMPMKVKRLGPSLLASELILPLEVILTFLGQTGEIGTRFRATIFHDVQIVRSDEGYRAVTISLFTCDQRQFLKYMLYLALVQIISRTGIKLGGKPYGIGIWNAAFLRSKFSREKLSEYRSYKRRVDPASILNPLKFTAAGSRFFGIPSLMFNRFCFNMAIDLMIRFSPLLEIAVRMRKAIRDALPLGRPAEKKGRLVEAIFQCTNCGACAAVCPAWLVTHDEAVIARSRLRLARHLLINGGDLTGDEASKVFQCLRCGQCQEVCQSNLPLVECWDELDLILEQRYGKPDAVIADFVGQADARHDYLKRIADYKDITERWK